MDMQKKIKNTLLFLTLIVGAGTYFYKKDKIFATIINGAKSQNELKIFTKQQVIEDIDYVLKIVKQYHISAIDKIPEEVSQQRDLEIKNLKYETDQLEVYRIISRILTKLHDAHSICWIQGAIHRSPFDIKVVDDKFFCTSGKFKDAEILKLNGKTILELYEIFKQHLSYEIEEWAHFNFFNPFITFLSERLLILCNIDILKSIEITFKKGDDIVNEKFELIPIKDSDFQDRSKWVSYNIDKENGVEIFKLDRCIFNEEYCKTVNKFFEEVATNDIKNIIIDLRSNSGGNSEVMNFFIKYIKNAENLKDPYEEAEIRKVEILSDGNDKKVNNEDFEKIKKERDSLYSKYSTKHNLFDGKIFVTTSNGTFSSGMGFALLFADNNLGTIVGEVPGNSPTCFGDCSPEYFTPNARINFHTTFKKFYRKDLSKDPDRLIPDVQVKAEDAIKKIYELIKQEK